MQYRNAITVFIVDKQPIVRWGLRHFLETQNFAVLDDAGSLSEAEEKLDHLKPDVIVLDTSLLKTNIASTIKELTVNDKGHILGFSTTESWGFVENFVNSGGNGIVSKRCPPDDLVNAIRSVANNQIWISPSIRKMASRYTNNKKSNLSSRELEVVTLIAYGYTSRQIANQLCVSIKTVETHRYRIFKRLNVNSRAELVNFAFEHQLIKIQPQNAS